MSIHSRSLTDGRAARALFRVVACAGWALLANARETLFRVDFGQEGTPRTFEKVGRFQGALPPNVHENFAAWNASVARAERLTENGRAFLRIHADKVDSSTQFWINEMDIALPGVFELVVTARPRASTLQFGLRQVGAPYRGFGDVDFPVSGEWKERRFLIQTRERCDSKVAIYFYTGGGDTDIASVELVRLSK